ncbi:hypothetical protein MWMV17_MWMV17_00664 [Acinetobacter calcoaceticus]|uniref:Uncharacterized protein n=1 Tax=Acinetobacter calcoaceticus DSM 30006 = CIP 81.8 TaxID=981331 RepID=A0ABP2UF67_ACICA|nr:hypothetical protein F936_02071 [Acinetobacter calcoaceticus DSM 30006 = CIP 81.8]CAI3111142.1 hypothetical protein MWMV17_MWMV17_00664 [Acinetobacter calcoaceticus]SUU55767.1 Uncharacterised protein [Acinetobacter calcoaceticus]
MSKYASWTLGFLFLIIVYLYFVKDMTTQDIADFIVDQVGITNTNK